MQPEHLSVEFAGWEIIARVYEALSGSAPLEERLRQGLEILIHRHQRGAAIWLEEPEQIWLSLRCPPAWNQQVHLQRGTLPFLIQKIMRDGEAILQPTDNEIGALLPIEWEKEVFGVLILTAPELNSEEIVLWKEQIQPFARILARERQQNPGEAEQWILQVHQFLNEIHLNSPASDIQQIMAQFTAAARDLLNADDAALILTDHSNPTLAIKRRLGLGKIWSGQTSLRLEESLTRRALESRQILQTRDNGYSSFHPEIDRLPDLPVESLICAPLLTDEMSLGVMQIINPQRDLKNPLLHSAFLLLINSLASWMAKEQQATRLKITSAEMEARLWEITKSRNTLRTLFDSIPSSIYIIDRSYRIVAINQPRSQRARSEPRQLVGRRCYEALYGRSEICPECRVMETLTQAVTTTRALHEWMEDDRFVDWEITTYPIQEKNNLPHQVIIFEQDVTEKRSLEANLIQSEKMAAVGQLAAGIAHEINNPLAAIIANTQLLKRELLNDSADFMETLQLIETASLRAANVVSGLLGISRKENKYEFEPLSLNESIRAALALVHHDLVRRSIEVVTDLQEDMPSLIASKTHLQSIWINLLVNSMDAINKENGRISITTRYTERNFTIIFEDNGKGIPQEYLSRIFEPFFTTKAAGRGTGLGLAITQRVIKEHQGDIRIESQLGQGVKITITLPDIPRG
ncbi:MAG: ATP-binding protein [Chloroflexota bacterium]